MRTAALVLGIVGGVFGIIAGVIVMLVGDTAVAFHHPAGHALAGRGFLAVLIAVIAIVGGAVAPAHPKTAGLLELTTGLVGYALIPKSWVLAGPVLIAGAILAFIGGFRGKPLAE